eukprot:2199983-Rhodomonas_salina.1
MHFFHPIEDALGCQTPRGAGLGTCRAALASTRSRQSAHRSPALAGVLAKAALQLATTCLPEAPVPLPVRPRLPRQPPVAQLLVLLGLQHLCHSMAEEMEGIGYQLVVRWTPVKETHWFESPCNKFFISTLLGFRHGWWRAATPRATEPPSSSPPPGEDKLALRGWLDGSSSVGLVLSTSGEGLQPQARACFAPWGASGMNNR